MPTRPLAKLLLTGLVTGAISAPGVTFAAPDRPIAEMVMLDDGPTRALPGLRTDIDAAVAGDLVTVTVRQSFAAPPSAAAHARYQFPLPETAAVFKMTLKSGDQIIRAQIQQRDQARATFQKAQESGRSAALLRQHRPNLFTQDVANLMPGQPIEVTLAYVQTVPRIDGVYELALPLVVGPRYEPSRQQRDAATAAAAPPAIASDTEAATTPTPAEPTPETAQPAGVWRFGQPPTYPPVAGLSLPPDVIDPDRVGIAITLDGGMPIVAAESPTHALAQTVETAQRRRLTLAAGRTIDNRDFVLRYRLGGERTVSAGLLAHHDRRGGFFSLLLEPPPAPPTQDVTPRDMVFVLDCSGSMSGEPLEAAKLFMRHALATLKPTDTFRIIRFSDRATEYSSRPIPATPIAIRQGLAYLETLRGEGGTDMASGIVQALAVPIPEGSLRLVTFLTDGYIGNEDDVLRLINRHLGASRLFALGVGTSVNRYLLAEMSRAGRGFARILDPTESAQAVAAEVSQRLQTPLLTDITIDWGTIAPTELSEPGRLPDLFAGSSYRLEGRYAAPGRHHIVIFGKVNGRTATLPLEIDLPGHGEDGTGEAGAAGDAGEAVALLWARSAIEREMRRLAEPQGTPPIAEVEQRVTQLGLDFSLTSAWTSFVAVADQVVNLNPAAAATLPVPLPMVAGITANAYAPHQAPEPEAGAGLLVILLLAGWWMTHRRGTNARSAATGGGT